MVDSKATIGVEFCSKSVSINNTVIKAQVWDTAGQERYRSITSSYYRGSNGAVIVYDVTNRESFECVARWFKELKEFGGMDDEDLVVLVVGNKNDLKLQRQVSIEDGKAYCMDLGV